MIQRAVNFQSGPLNLEGRLTIPSSAKLGAGVVICHPHPLYGGSMDNNVVQAIAGALAEGEIAALCFNFRGVGRSTGAHDGNLGEIEDTLAAIAFLSGNNGIDPLRMGLAGYSFGGSVALNTAFRSSGVKAAAAVSPPEIPDFGTSVLPRLIIFGSEDTLIPASTILGHKERITGPAGTGAIEIIKGADHFWHLYEQPLAVRIATFFQKCLQKL